MQENQSGVALHIDGDFEPTEGDCVDLVANLGREAKEGRVALIPGRTVTESGLNSDASKGDKQSLAKGFVSLVVVTAECISGVFDLTDVPCVSRSFPWGRVLREWESTAILVSGCDATLVWVNRHSNQSRGLPS